MTPLRRGLLLACAVIGLGASSASSYVHYHLLTSPAYSSFCDVSATVSCTEAYTSRYGSFLGVPVAIAGVMFFTLVLALAALSRGTAPRDAHPAATYIFALSTIGLVFAIYLAWASYAVLGVFCILCALTYVAVIALWIVSGTSMTVPLAALPGRAARDFRSVLASPASLLATLVIAGGSLAALAYFPREGPAPAAAQVTIPPLAPAARVQLEEWWAMQPVVELPVARSRGAKVQILVFSDYQCPACRAAHDELDAVLAGYDRSVVELVLKHYPLEPECNPHAAGSNHFASCEAAAAYVMARGTPAQDRLSDWLFDNQRSLTKDLVRAAAKDYGGIADFDQRYNEALQEVKADAELGAALKVRFTPTIYLNGRMIAGNGNGLPPAQGVAGLIDIELKKSP